MKKQLLNLSAVVAAMFLISSVSFAQLTEPIETLSVPAIESVDDFITLDGLITEGGWSDAVPVGELFNSPDDFDGDADLSANFYTCWNNVGFYVAFEVQDNEAHNYDGETVDGNNSWEFDNVELFFNIDTAGVSSSGNYAPDGIQMRFCRGLSGSDGMPGWGNGEPGKDTMTTDTTYQYDAVPTEYTLADQSSSWSIEILVPWGYIVPTGTLPEDIHDYIEAQKAAIGFDVSVADSDGTEAQVGARDAQMAWDADVAGSGTEEDNAWQDLRVLGVVSLAGTPISSVTTTSASGVEVYPNPSSNVINFNNLNGVNSIEIINMLGQTIQTVDVAGQNVVLSVSNLAAGNYIAVLHGVNTSETLKIAVQ